MAEVYRNPRGMTAFAGFLSSPSTYLLSGTLLFLVAVLFIPLFTLVVVINTTFGPYSVLAISIAVPILFVPCAIMLIRFGRKLLRYHHIIKSKSTEEQLSHESFRQKLALYLETSLPGALWMGFQVIITLLACAIYVIETYDYKFRAMNILEFSLSFLFAIDYLIFFYCARDRLQYFLSFFAMIDFITIYPFFISLFFSVLRASSSFLRAMRVLRCLRILRTYRLLNFSHSSIQKQFTILFFTLFSLLFCATAMIQFAETFDSVLGKANPFYYFHECLYFMVVTFATVGFGDIHPISDLGRMIIVMMLILSMFLIPYQSYKLIQLITEDSPYAGKLPHDRRKHFVIIGHMSTSRVIHLLRELFHQSKVHKNIRVVLLSEDEPSEEIKRLLWHPFYKSRMIFLVGSAMQKRDLKRAALGNAKACFILTEENPMHVTDSDDASLLRFLAVKDYSPDLFTCVQLNQSHLRSTCLDISNQCPVMSKDILMSVLAKSCQVPGFSTLLSNLLNTYSLQDLRPEWKHTWRQEYQRGASHEIYAFYIPHIMSGILFCDAVAKIYEEESGALLFAIHSDIDPLEPILNPSQYTLHGGELAYLIALDYTTTEKLRKEKSNNSKYIELAPLTLESYNTNKNHSSHEIDSFEENVGLTQALYSAQESVYGWKPFLFDYAEFPCEQGDSVIEDVKDMLSNHIIVCGNIIDLVQFIAPLRTIENQELLPILIVTPVIIPMDIWEIIGRFPEIYVMIGSPKAVTIQKRCRIDAAKTFVILQQGGGNQYPEGDYQAILLYRELKSSFPRTNVLIEMLDTNHVRFLRPGIGSGKERHQSQTAHSNMGVNGRLFHPAHHYNPFYVSGSVCTPSIADSLLCHLVHNRNIYKIVELFMSGGSVPRQVEQSSHLYQMVIPDEFRDNSYGQLFNFYIQQNIIAIGLYRTRTIQGIEEQFVFTNPHPTTAILDKDLIFIIGHRDQLFVEAD